MQTSAPTPNDAPTFRLPTLYEGEHYVGIALIDEEGHPNYHLILLPQCPAYQLDWNAAIAWAKSIGAELPTRQEQALLYANARQDFTASYYWSSEQTEPLSSHAWGQNFTHGGQAHLDKAAYEVRTRAVRRQLID